jgi:hypothetical protein
MTASIADWRNVTWVPVLAAEADRYRAQLVATYSAERGKLVLHAEAFDISGYGAPLTSESKA